VIRLARYGALGKTADDPHLEFVTIKMAVDRLQNES
jgi:hypothetical protein